MAKATKLSSLSIFFPFYNDAGTVAKSINNAFSVGRKLAKDFEVIAIHGGPSKDSTHLEITKIQAKFPDLIVIDKRDNREGYAVIKHGFKTATKDWVFYTDGDAQYDIAKDLPRLVQKQLETGADVINGYKKRRNDNIFRVFFGEIYKRFGVFLFDLPIKDVDCDFRLIRKSFLDLFELKSKDASILPELLLQLQLVGANFAEVGVRHYKRVYGRSNYTLFKLIKEKLLGDLGLYSNRMKLIENRTKEFSPSTMEYKLMFENEEAHWWYKGLRDLLVKWIKEVKPTKILDAGCGTGINIYTLRKTFNKVDVVGCDVSEEAINYCKERGLPGVKKGSITALPYRRESFDCIYCFDVIGCLEPIKLQDAIKEFSRCLKTGGYLILNTAALRWLYSEHDRAWDIRKRYNVDELTRILSENGFEIKKATYRLFLLFPAIAVAKILSKIKKRMKKRNRKIIGDLKPFFKPANFLLQKIMKIENLLLDYIDLPIGTSVFIVVKKAVRQKIVS